MTSSTLICNAQIVSDGQIRAADVRIQAGRIVKIDATLDATAQDQMVDAQGAYLLPGFIDDQVHFREPGLTHKGTIASESRAAVAGGITSFMEMPNVNPATTHRAALEHKYALAAQHAMANYAFYLGATEDNLEEIKALDPTRVCGVKVFMGASTGSLLVEQPAALEAIFNHSPVLVVTHCESGPVIQRNLNTLLQHKAEPTIEDHPRIRDVAACYASSSYAVSLAKRFATPLHVLHITTAKELELFAPGPVHNKQITAEACVHHLWFSDQDYARLGNLIKCNPAVKSAEDRAALINALHTGLIDIIATDHAPHTLAEKQQAYPAAPAGLPLVEHALLSVLDQVNAGRLTLTQVVEKTAHNPALRYGIVERGFIREGYFADLVLVRLDQTTDVSHHNTRYHCGWTPFDGQQFRARIQRTWVNGQQVFDGSAVLEQPVPSQPLRFNPVR